MEARSLCAQTVHVKPVRFEELVALAKRLNTSWIEINQKEPKG
jgi:hypothetical protein